MGPQLCDDMRDVMHYGDALTLTKRQFLDRSKLKAFADDKFT